MTRTLEMSQMKMNLRAMVIMRRIVILIVTMTSRNPSRYPRTAMGKKPNWTKSRRMVLRLSLKVISQVSGSCWRDTVTQGHQPGEWFLLKGHCHSRSSARWVVLVEGTLSLKVIIQVSGSCWRDTVTQGHHPGEWFLLKGHCHSRSSARWVVLVEGTLSLKVISQVNDACWSDIVPGDVTLSHWWFADVTYCNPNQQQHDGQKIILWFFCFDRQLSQWSWQALQWYLYDMSSQHDWGGSICLSFDSIVKFLNSTSLLLWFQIDTKGYAHGQNPVFYTWRPRPQDSQSHYS